MKNRIDKHRLVSIFHNTVGKLCGSTLIAQATKNLPVPVSIHGMFAGPVLKRHEHISLNEFTTNNTHAKM